MKTLEEVKAYALTQADAHFDHALNFDAVVDAFHDGQHRAYRDIVRKLQEVLDHAKKV